MVEVFWRSNNPVLYLCCVTWKSTWNEISHYFKSQYHNRTKLFPNVSLFQDFWAAEETVFSVCRFLSLNIICLIIKRKQRLALHPPLHIWLQKACKSCKQSDYLLRIGHKLVQFLDTGWLPSPFIWNLFSDHLFDKPKHYLKDYLFILKKTQLDCLFYSYFK